MCLSECPNPFYKHRSLFSHELQTEGLVWLSTQETKEKPRQRRQRRTKIKKFGVSQQVSKPFPITFDASNVLQSLFSHEFQTEGLVWLSTQETQERSKYGKLSCSPIISKPYSIYHDCTMKTAIWNDQWKKIYTCYLIASHTPTQIWKSFRFVFEPSFPKWVKMFLKDQFKQGQLFTIHVSQRWANQEH